jgi:hypothetical protein
MLASRIEPALEPVLKMKFFIIAGLCVELGDDGLKEAAYRGGCESA